MPTYKAPVDDTLFLLNDVFHLDRYGNLPGFADASPDLVEAVLREAGEVRRGSAHPAQPGRRQGRLHTPRRRQRDHPDRLQGRLQAIGRGRLDRHLGAGRIRRPGPAGDADRRGQRNACSANMAFAMYPGLTHGAIAALLEHASQELKTRYLPKMVTGEWTGTMNLTEPHGGTDLGLLAHQGGPAGGRQLPDHRQQDFHLRRRARHGGQHHPSGARAHRRRAGRHQGHFALHRAEVHGRRTTARSASATASSAARSKRRWASTAIRPA